MEKIENKGSNLSKYFTICIEFGCNNNCISCMLRDIKGKLKPVPFEDYVKILNENLKYQKYDSLILSGAEVTTNKKLLNFVKCAESLGGFKHIRIQTNGRRLSDYYFCKSLVRAGIDEFFITIQGPNPEIHERMTRIRGSFIETLKGIENVNKLNASILTNTVVTKLNYKFLPDIVTILSTFKRIREINFWNYWPMSKDDEYNLIESNKKIIPYLSKAIEEGCNKKIPMVIKGFPECLLNGNENLLDNSQPETITDDLVWKKYAYNELGRCVYGNSCSSKECEGLTCAYIRKFGWDQDCLKPIKSGLRHSCISYNRRRDLGTRSPIRIERERFLEKFIKLCKNKKR